MQAHERFKMWRESQGTQDEVAIRLGISQAYVSAIENGDKLPGLKAANAIAAATKGATGGQIRASDWPESAPKSRVA